MSKKILTIPKKGANVPNARPTLADLERESVARSRAYVEQKLAEFKAIRTAAGFED